MKFPFVILPRAVYEQLLAERALSAKLTKTIIRMKVAGGTVPRPFGNARLTPKATREFDDAVQDAIERNPHVGRPGMRARLMSFVDNELAKGTKEATILHRLRTWYRIDSAADDPDDDVIMVITEKPDAPASSFHETA